MLLFDIISEIIERIMPDSFAPKRSIGREIAGAVFLFVLLALGIYFVLVY